eukprot:scaffold11129_cov20-Tisochrysis_lutea.AAC.1
MRSVTLYCPVLCGIQLAKSACRPALVNPSSDHDERHLCYVPVPQVRHSAGQKRMQALTGESIVRAARGWLRWSGEPQDMA